MKDITLTVHKFILKETSSGKTRTGHSVLNLRELASLIEEHEKEAARSKVGDVLAELYGSDSR